MLSTLDRGDVVTGAISAVCKAADRLQAQQAADPRWAVVMGTDIIRRLHGYCQDAQCDCPHHRRP